MNNEFSRKFKINFVVYVDNMIIWGTSFEVKKKLIHRIFKMIKISNCEPIKYIHEIKNGKKR
jgi:hypothetical protein